MKETTTSLRPGVYRFNVDNRFAGLRIDQYLAEISPIITRGLARRLIDLGGVHLTGRRIRHCSEKIVAGDLIEVYVDNLEVNQFELDQDRILYRDKYVIVIDKPSGIPTQPTPARFKGTIYAQLKTLLRDQKYRQEQLSIGMVQRLDQNTSGVMVFSIHPKAHKNLTEDFRKHRVEKTYLALVLGTPEEKSGRFCSQLAKRRSTNLMVSVSNGGKYAETRYRLVKLINQVSLIEAELFTGRTHQIRAHFAEAGMPLLGDAAYGGPKTLGGVDIPRQMLHAHCLSFTHPVSGEKMTITASLPADFAGLIERLAVACKHDHDEVS